MAELILPVTRRRDHLLDITTLMPRHGLVGRPRHRAKRQGLWSARGVRLDTARLSAPHATPLPHEPPPARSLAQPSRQWLRGQIFHLVRGAVVTPWFAVSVGIVIATTLTLARPHPALTFPPRTTGRCVKAPCAVTSPSAPGPAIKHGLILPLPRHYARSRFAAVKVEYQLLFSRHHRFVAVILIVSRHRLGWWQLKFTLYGAKIDNIMWVKWRPEGRDGVIVAGSPAPWSASADRSAANEARIVVIGAGTPAWPARCRFDGAICRFRGLPKRAGRYDKGHGGG